MDRKINLQAIPILLWVLCLSQKPDDFAAITGLVIRPVEFFRQVQRRTTIFVLDTEIRALAE